MSASICILCKKKQYSRGCCALSKEIVSDKMKTRMHIIPGSCISYNKFDRRKILIPKQSRRRDEVICNLSSRPCIYVYADFIESPHLLISMTVIIYNRDHD